MSQSKLHVLDLMVCAKYLNNNDIFKLKYISKSFEDIQDRILINHNPIIEINDIPLIKIKFPNIQTTNISIKNTYLFINYNNYGGQCYHIHFHNSVNHAYEKILRLGYFTFKENLKYYYNEYIKNIPQKDANVEFNMLICSKLSINKYIDEFFEMFNDNHKYTIYIYSNQNIQLKKQIGNVKIIINNPVYIIKSYKEYEMLVSISHCLTSQIKTLIFDGQNQQLYPINNLNFNGDVIFRNFSKIEFNSLHIKYCENLIFENINKIKTFAIEIKDNTVKVQFIGCHYKQFPIRLTNAISELGKPELSSNKFVFADIPKLKPYTENIKLNSNVNKNQCNILDKYYVNYNIKPMAIKCEFITNIITEFDILHKNINSSHVKITYTHKHYFISFDSITKHNNDYLIHLTKIKMVCLKNDEIFEYEQNFNVQVVISNNRIIINNNIRSLFSNPKIKQLRDLPICKNNKIWIDDIIKFRYSLLNGIVNVDENTKSGTIYY